MRPPRVQMFRARRRNTPNRRPAATRERANRRRRNVRKAEIYRVFRSRAKPLCSQTRRTRSVRSNPSLPGKKITQNRSLNSTPAPLRTVPNIPEHHLRRSLKIVCFINERFYSFFFSIYIPFYFFTIYIHFFFYNLYSFCLP